MSETNWSQRVWSRGPEVPEFWISQSSSSFSGVPLTILVMWARRAWEGVSTLRPPAAFF